MGKLDLDYWLVQARDDKPGQLSQRELSDVIAEMTAEEFGKLKAALREYNHVAATITIRESIERQYHDLIYAAAYDDHQSHLETLKEDSKPAKERA